MGTLISSHNSQRFVLQVVRVFSVSSAETRLLCPIRCWAGRGGSCGTLTRDTTSAQRGPTHVDMPQKYEFNSSFDPLSDDLRIVENFGLDIFSMKILSLL